MPKETILICIDNSEYMRNGDYSPSRMDSQLDASNLICGAKTQQNPETTLGILTMGGKSPSVQVSPTSNLGQLLSSLSALKIQGKSNFGNSLRVAQLALKRRSTDQSQNGARRIIAFVGSPLQESEEELENLANKLKKNNISIDVVNFGEEKLNTKKLELFINISNGEGDEKTCSLVTVPPGPHVLSDILLTSAIVQGQDSVSSGNNGGTSSVGQFAEYGGIDPNVDPDLALAIKMSMEEEKRRQDKEKGEKSEKKETKVQEEEMIDDELYGDDEDEMDEEAMIQQALALSMQENKKEDKMEEENYDEDLYGDEEDEEEDEDLKMAMALSMKQPTDENVQDILQDDEYLNSVLDGLPGVDMKKDEKKKEDEEKK